MPVELHCDHIVNEHLRHDKRRVKHERVDALGRYYSQESSYDTLLASNLTTPGQDYPPCEHSDDNLLV